MPILPTQDQREVSVSSALGDDMLLFVRMHCSEALGRMFKFEIELASTKNDIKIADVLGKSMTVALDLPKGGRRYFNGIVTRFVYRGQRDGMASYLAVVQPALWLLTRSTNCRIFQDHSVIDILKAICNGPAYGGQFALDAGKLSRTLPVRTYCVQYRESDFNFVVRLLEEEGIYFHFTHDKDAHTMVLADGYSAHTAVDGYATIKLREEEPSRTALEEVITRFALGGEIQSDAYVHNEFDFENITKSLGGGMLTKAVTKSGFDRQPYEQYDYPGGYATFAEGLDWARARIEVLHGQYEMVEANGTARGLTTGALFTLTEHPRDDENREFLITSSTTEITGIAYASGGASGSTEFRCAFTAVGKEHSYRPQPMARKPFVQGLQTAIVVGKAGEEISTDKYGRVKLQFHWDRDGENDENSSCFVRVQQGWAGKNWGMIFLPRIGMEVVVSFLEGDPDRPLVTGCVYNGDSMPPYTLPAEQTKSTIKSNSSKGGGGFNEIRFEDKKGSEEILIQAEKDFNRVVKNNDTLKVGFEKADKGNQTVGIKNDQSLEVGHDQVIKIANNQTVQIANNQTVQIDGDQVVKVIKTALIEADQSITLKVGASSITIEPGKITIKSPEIAVEADGMMKAKAGAIMTIEGAIVKIN